MIRPTPARCLAIGLLLFSFHALAQNLVVNPGFESGNTGFSTDYAIWPGNPGWGGGHYYVTNKPQSGFGGWTSPGDHTSGSGNFLLVDGSPTAGTVFWRETLSVDANTSYAFSVWGLTIDSDSPPILYFTVNGAQQGTFYVLPATPSGWHAYGVTWNSGATNSAKLELRLQSNKGGPGNNIVVDDVSFTRSSDIPSTVAAVAAAAQIQWLAYPGATYQVQWTTSINTNSWNNLGSPIVGNGLTNYMSDPLGANARRFYRILQIN